MTSIYSSISIETGLVTHFSGYKTIMLHYTAQKMKFSIKDFFSKCDQIRSFLWIWSHLLKKSFMENTIFCVVLKGMLYILNHDSFCIGYSDVLNKLAAIVYSLCFKKQALELLLHLYFKAELPTNGLQDISFLVLKSMQM